MKRVLKVIFCLFLLLVSILYIKDYYVSSLNINSSINNVNTNYLFKSLVKSSLYNSDNFNISDINYMNLSNDKKINNEDNYTFYIYNTHQSEEYANDEVSFYGIKPNVVTSSYILEEALSNEGFKVLVEERSVLDVVRKNNWSYPATYTVTASFINEVKEKYSGIKYFIDLHRDGAPRSATYVNIEGKDYAKIMFTIGKDRENLDNNLKKVDKLREYLNNNYNGILRNNFYRENDSFNQELADDVFLIEVGGQYNNLNEIYNSLVALSKAFVYLEESL